MSAGIQTHLLDVLGLLYRMQPDEEKQLAADLLDQSKQAWYTAIGEKAREYGYRGPVRYPSLGDLEYLKNLCRLDAQSIAATWNRDVARQLQKLYAANPRGNRYYYAKHMEAWVTQRSSWKSRQIATQTEQAARTYAIERFLQENGLRGGMYLFDGPPPVCGDCVQLYGMGPVDQRFVDRHRCPRHIGCTHEWRELRGPTAPPPADLWVG
jgi:hypothetical protein